MHALSSTTRRFNSTLHQRDSRSALFEGYSGSGADNATARRQYSASPSSLGGGYGFGGSPYSGGNNSSSSGNGAPNHLGVGGGGVYRPATPNSKYVSDPGRWHPIITTTHFDHYVPIIIIIAVGFFLRGGLTIFSFPCARCRGQYSDAVLNELESQNDQQVEGIMGKVKILKEVSVHPPPPDLV